MKREDIIRDIHGLEAELAALEEQYGLLCPPTSTIYIGPANWSKRATSFWRQKV